MEKTEIKTSSVGGTVAIFIVQLFFLTDPKVFTGFQQPTEGQ